MLGLRVGGGAELDKNRRPRLILNLSRPRQWPPGPSLFEHLDDIIYCKALFLGDENETQPWSYRP